MSEVVKVPFTRSLPLHAATEPVNVRRVFTVTPLAFTPQYDVYIASL